MRDNSTESTKPEPAPAADKGKGQTWNIPPDIDEWLTAVASNENKSKYKMAMECLREALKPRWDKLVALKLEYWQMQANKLKASNHAASENGQEPIRRGAVTDAGEAAKENRSNKAARKGPGRTA
jgi:hypothetical protein